MLNEYSGIICWFSGGKDSAIACYIAKRVADIRGVSFRLVHIYTRTPRPHEVDEYLQTYAKWLGTTLEIIMPEYSFAEYAWKYARWPVLYYGRWCYYVLKRVTITYFLRNDPMALKALHVFGIRKNESLFREHEYKNIFGIKCYEKGLCIQYWLPLLYMDSLTLIKLMKNFNIPESPVWKKLGYSGECMCLAGMTLKTLTRLAVNYPEVVEELVAIDDIIQSRRYKNLSYPAPLINKRLTLRQWWEQFKRQPHISDF